MSVSAFKSLGIEKTIDLKIKEIQSLYQENKIPWVIGYSGGKDSTAVTQLTWMAINSLPIEERKKPIYVITTDTMVENPVVSNWVESSLQQMKSEAKLSEMPIKPNLLKPELKDRFWVNLIGKGYPAPRRGFRWCTDRLKIRPSNNFIKRVVSKHGEAIMLLGVRSAESAARAKTIKTHNREGSNLSDHQNLPNCKIFSPIVDWSNDDVWVFLDQYSNPWNYSNEKLKSMYQGATEDNECPVVVDTSTPSCGSSRFGCWVCTLVQKDKSMDAMIKNDQEKEWMSPLLKIRDEIDFHSDKAQVAERAAREFSRLSGEVSFYTNKSGDIDTVPGPYTKAKRIKILEKVLKAEARIEDHFELNKMGESTQLISFDELEEIRRIWIEDKHEIEDEIPEIYQRIKGKKYEGKTYRSLAVLNTENLDVLESLCESQKEYEMVRNLLVKEMKLKSSGVRRGFINQLEKELNKFLYITKDEALEAGHKRQDIIKSIEIQPLNDYEGIKI